MNKNTKILKKEPWIKELHDVITDPNKLLNMLLLDNNKDLLDSCSARKLFPLRVPRSFIKRMKKGDANDPLFLQIFTDIQEFKKNLEYTKDPLKEKNKILLPGLIHKYKNRVLLITKNSCAINCRYCFRRHFPYWENQGNKNNWIKAIHYIKKNKNLDEVVFSGGDPLIAKDEEIRWLIDKLNYIPHLKRLRIHSRLPVVIPSRITEKFCQFLKESRLKIVFVTHINHAQEFDKELIKSIKKLKNTGITLLNQSVLLKKINNNANVLANLSNVLFDNGIIPYYLHLLDKVQGVSHFYVTDTEAKNIFRKLLTMLSGYMVPKLVRDIPGHLSKKIIL